ncbi:MAG TPA: hypothetical protein EYG73_06615 [Arcobacter sp.]|nr:hypothetical protein [Arcobacter sp.]
MAKEKNFDNLDLVIKTAHLSEKKKSSTNKKKKMKSIQLLVHWEENIKEYHGGTIASYITIAIQEKMKRDGIL